MGAEEITQNATHKDRVTGNVEEVQKCEGNTQKINVPLVGTPGKNRMQGSQY